MPKYRVHFYRYNSYKETGYVDVEAESEDNAQDEADEKDISWGDDDEFSEKGYDVEYEYVEALDEEDQDVGHEQSDSTGYECGLRKLAKAEGITSKDHKLIANGYPCAHCGRVANEHDWFSGKMNCIYTDGTSALNEQPHTHPQFTKAQKKQCGGPEACSNYVYAAPTVFYSYHDDSGGALLETTLCEVHASDMEYIETMRQVAEAGGAWDGNEMRKLGGAGKSKIECLICKQEARFEAKKAKAA